MRLVDIEHKTIEEAGKVKDFIGKVREKFTKKKKTTKKVANDNYKLGRSLQRMMKQYAMLKQEGKGDSREAKRLGAAIGKIKNSLRGPKADKTA